MRLREAYDRLPFSSKVELETFREHCPGAHVAPIRAGTRIFRAGERGSTFHFVVTGRVKLVRERSGGSSTILSIAMPGELLCPAVPHAAGLHCCDALVDGWNTRVLAIAGSEWHRLMAEVPEASAAFVEMLSSHCTTMCARAQELSAGRVEQRIAALLLRLAEKDGESVRVDISLSRRELAQLTGTTSETASRVMGRLAKRGLVETCSVGFVIHDEAALCRLAEGRSESTDRAR